MRGLSACTLICLFSVAAASANEWPRFRGPNGSGIHPTAKPPVDFGPDENLAWRTPVPFSRSSPVLGGPCVFLTALDGNDFVTLCLDRRTGDERWRRSVRRERTTEIYASNDATSPSPVTDENNVYVFFPDFGLVAYSHDGDERWRRPLGPFNQFFGMASSPVLVGETLALLCDQQTNSFLLLVAANDGRVVAELPRAHGVDSMATPTVHAPQDGPAQLVVFSSRRVDAYAVPEGELVWWARKVGYGAVSSPVLSDGRVYVNVPRGDATHLEPMDRLLDVYDDDGDGQLARSEVESHAILGERFGSYDPDHNGFVERHEYGPIRLASTSSDDGLVAIELGGAGDVTATHIRWRHQKNLSPATTPLVYNNVVYIIRSGGILTSLDAASGNVYKTGRTSGALGAYYASPVAADDKLFVVSADCEIAVVRARAQWELLAVNALDESHCYATPAIDQTRIYVRSGEAVYAFAKH